MKTKTEIDNELIDQSVAHWERMRDDVNCGEEPNGNFCALCGEHPDCIGCPVMLKTGQDNCDRSPWWPAYVAFWEARDFPTPENLAAWRTAAQAEIDFLKGLKK